MLIVAWCVIVYLIIGIVFGNGVAAFQPMQEYERQADKVLPLLVAVTLFWPGAVLSAVVNKKR